MGVIEGCVSVKSLLDLSKQHHVTITEFLVALWIYSIYEGMSIKEQKKPVVISIPVNLRNYFPSETTRTVPTKIDRGRLEERYEYSFCVGA